MPTSVPNFNFLAVLVSEIKRVFYYPPAVPRTLKLLCVLKVVLARSNSVPNFSIISLCIMQLCEYVFPIGLPLKALPCVNARLLMYRMSKSVQRPEL